MANPNWKKGMISPNMNGRGKMKEAAKSLKGRISRAVKKIATDKEIIRLYNAVDDYGKMYMLEKLFPYILSKQPTQVDMTIEKLNDNDLNALYLEVMSGVQGALLPDGFSSPILIPETIKTNDNESNTDDL